MNFDDVAWSEHFTLKGRGRAVIGHDVKLEPDTVHLHALPDQPPYSLIVAGVFAILTGILITDVRRLVDEQRGGGREHFPGRVEGPGDIGVVFTIQRVFFDADRRLVHAVPDGNGPAVTFGDLTEALDVEASEFFGVAGQPFGIVFVPEKRMSLGRDVIFQAPCHESVGRRPPPDIRGCAFLISEFSLFRLNAAPVKGDTCEIEEFQKRRLIFLICLRGRQLPQDKQVGAKQEIMRDLFHGDACFGNGVSPRIG